MEDILDQNREAERIFRQYGKLLTAVAAAQLPGGAGCPYGGWPPWRPAWVWCWGW